MNTEQDQALTPGEGAHAVQQQQQEQQQPSDRHGGQGAESALRQLRAWEHDRAANSGGKRRQSPS